MPSLRRSGYAQAQSVQPVHWLVRGPGQSSATPKEWAAGREATEESKEPGVPRSPENSGRAMTPPSEKTVKPFGSCRILAEHAADFVQKSDQVIQVEPKPFGSCPDFLQDAIHPVQRSAGPFGSCQHFVGDEARVVRCSAEPFGSCPHCLEDEPHLLRGGAHLDRSLSIPFGSWPRLLWEVTQQDEVLRHPGQRMLQVLPMAWALLRSHETLERPCSIIQRCNQQKEGFVARPR